jgi:hypothetical protein
LVTGLLLCGETCVSASYMPDPKVIVEVLYRVSSTNR